MWQITFQQATGELFAAWIAKEELAFAVGDFDEHRIVT
jgi:hypothetical protein